MLTLLSSPFYTFFSFSYSFLEKRFSIGRTGSIQIINSAHMSRYCRIFRATKVKDATYHQPWRYTRCARSHTLDEAGGFLCCGDRLSPIRFYPCRL
jgi:hypothetical protein